MTPDDIATIDAAMRLLARYSAYGISIAIAPHGSVHFFAANLPGRAPELAVGSFDRVGSQTPGEAFADLARRLDK